jgi:hypothetical protein
MHTFFAKGIFLKRNKGRGTMPEIKKFYFFPFSLFPYRAFLSNCNLTSSTLELYIQEKWM